MPLYSNVGDQDNAKITIVLSEIGFIENSISHLLWIWHLSVNAFLMILWRVRDSHRIPSDSELAETVL